MSEYNDMVWCGVVIPAEYSLSEALPGRRSLLSLVVLCLLSYIFLFVLLLSCRVCVIGGRNYGWIDGQTGQDQIQRFPTGRHSLPTYLTYHLLT